MPNAAQSANVSGFVCPSCGGHSARGTAAPSGAILAQCLLCSAEMIHPIPNAEDLRRYYSNSNFLSDYGRGLAEKYEEDPTEAKLRAEGFQTWLRSLGIQDSARVVDVGCSFGIYVVEFAKLGYDAWGIDPSPDAVAFMIKHGTNAYAGFIDDSTCPVKWADVINSSHALEHMTDPYRTLRQMFGMLTPGGIINLALPNWGGFVAEKKKFDWKWFSPPAHIHYFKPDVLATVLRRTGFEIVGMSTTSFESEVEEISALCRRTGTIDDSLRTAVREILNSSLIGEGLMVVGRKPS